MAYNLSIHHFQSTSDPHPIRLRQHPYPLEAGEPCDGSVGAAVAGQFGNRKNCDGREPDRGEQGSRVRLSPSSRKAGRKAAKPDQETTSRSTRAIASAVAE